MKPPILHVVSVSGGKDSAATEVRPVVGYEGLYEVDTGGRVRRVGSGVWLKLQPRPGKYVGVNLWRDGKGKSHLVHRVVASAFCSQPAGCNEVNHKDGNKHNNAASNLEWTTRSANNLHAFRVLGRAPVLSCIGRIGKKHPLSKAVIGTPISGDGPPLRFESTHLAAAAGFCQTGVSRCARGLSKEHKGYRWTFVTTTEEPAACSSAYGLCE